MGWKGGAFLTLSAGMRGLAQERVSSYYGISKAEMKKIIQDYSRPPCAGSVDEAAVPPRPVQSVWKDSPRGRSVRS